MKSQIQKDDVVFIPERAIDIFNLGRVFACLNHGPYTLTCVNGELEKISIPGSSVWPYLLKLHDIGIDIKTGKNPS